MRGIAIIFIASALMSGSVFAQAPVELIDGREHSDAAEYGEWETLPAVLQAAGAARKHWLSKDADFEEEFRVLGLADGTFTEPGVRQHAVLFLMSLWPRCCPKMGLAIIQDGVLVRNIAFEGTAQELRGVADLDGDGLDELAYIGSFGMGGQTSNSLTLLSLKKDGVRDWGSTIIYDSACAAGYDGSWAARIVAVPGPSFMAENYTRPACESEVWEATGDPEQVELIPSTEVAYLELGVE